MGIRGLNWQTLQIPFSAGLESKQDPRLRQPPKLEIARDVQFELVGGLQTRPPFVAMSNAIFGGGTLSNCRRLAVVSDELCVFTDTALYSWNAQLSAWVRRDTHLAVSVTETPRFVTTGDQVDGDRAELNGTIVYAWTEGSQVYAAAIDKATGSVLVSQTAVSTAIGRPRLIALATRILLFVEATTTLLTVRSIDPAAPGTGIGGAGTTVLTTDFNLYYDVVRAGTQDLVVGACRRVTTTSYTAFTVTPGLVVTTATKARTCDGPIAVATIADGTQTQVVRGNGTNVQGDLLTTSTLADVFTAQAIGTAYAGPPPSAINQIAVEFSSTTATVFWSSEERADSALTYHFFLKKNTVTTANAVGSESVLVIALGVASRAFQRNGRIYVWAAFGSDSTTFGSGSPLGIRAQLQNTYFLYRDDGLVVSKATWDTAGGFSPSTGHLPGVSLVAQDQYAWLGAFRRRIDLGSDGTHSGLASRSLRDIAFAFDAGGARRSSQIGRTLYVSGGVVSQYDGVAIAEVGFHVYPWAFAATDSGIAGSIPPGTYSYKSTLQWQNATGERERSTTATGERLTTNPIFSRIVNIETQFLHVTNKIARPPDNEFWRTTNNSGVGAPFYLIGTQTNHADQTTSNVSDNLTDDEIVTKEANPENDGFLESLAPPGASIVIATDTRLFLAGVSGDPDRIWYSRERGDGEIASFHDALTIDVPPAGGAVTSIWFQDGVLFCGRETAIYSLPGAGLDNLGNGQGFGPAQTISIDVGPVSQEAQALTPGGTLFKSAKGWYLLDRGGGLRYVGGAVAAFDGDTVQAMHVMTAKHQVRILTNNRMLVWDYRGAVDPANPDAIGQWAEWTISDGVDAALWSGTYVYLAATGPKQEQAALTGLTYGLDVETSWIKLNDLQGFGKVGAIMVLGEYRSAHRLRVRVARDYQYDGAGNPVYYDDKAWTVSPTVVGSALQVRHNPSGSNGNCQAIKVRITAVSNSASASLLTTALSPQVATSGTVWNARWATIVPGTMGNVYTMSLHFEDGAPFAIDVRDHFAWDASSGRWLEDLNNIGVRVTCRTGSSPTVAQLEAAIVAATKLVTLTTPDVTPTKVVNATAMAGLNSTAAFSGGSYTSPTGEALRLSGLALEVGLDPRLNRRLPAEQKQ